MKQREKGEKKHRHTNIIPNVGWFGVATGRGKRKNNNFPSPPVFPSLRVSESPAAQDARIKSSVSFLERLGKHHPFCIRVLGSKYYLVSLSGFGKTVIEQNQTEQYDRTVVVTCKNSIKSFLFFERILLLLMAPAVNVYRSERIWCCLWFVHRKNTY